MSKKCKIWTPAGGIMCKVRTTGWEGALVMGFAPASMDVSARMMAELTSACG